MCYWASLVYILALISIFIVPTSFGRTSADIVSFCQNVPGSVCDPDEILMEGQARRLDSIIIANGANTTCPCNSQLCGTSPQGYRFKIALVRSIPQNVDVISSGSTLTRTLQIAVNCERECTYCRGRCRSGRKECSRSNDLEAQKLNSNLQTFKQLASMLLASWPTSRCDDAIVVLYSVNDSMLYTASQAAASALLTQDVVGEISAYAKMALRTDVVYGFQKLLSDYMLVLQGKYNRRTNMQRPDSEPETGKVVNRAATVISPSACNSVLIVVAVSCFLAQL